jgi:hypothetical protein
MYLSALLVGQIIAGSTAQSCTEGGGGSRSGSRGLSSEIWSYTLIWTLLFSSSDQHLARSLSSRRCVLMALIASDHGFEPESCWETFELKPWTGLLGGDAFFSVDWDSVEDRWDAHQETDSAGRDYHRTWLLSILSLRGRLHNLQICWKLTECELLLHTGKEHYCGFLAVKEFYLEKNQVLVP